MTPPFGDGTVNHAEQSTSSVSIVLSVAVTFSSVVAHLSSSLGQGPAVSPAAEEPGV